MRRSGASSSSSGGDSVVADVGRRRSTCGYCKSGRRSSVTHDLLDRGWRRSGCFLYKPEMETTCCPAYTIRLKADKFSPSKEQIRVSKRMQRYLDGIWDGKKQELADKSGESQVHAHGDTLSSTSQMESLGRHEQNTKDEELLDHLSKQIDVAIQSFVKSKDLPCDIQYPKGIVKKVSQTKKRRLVDGSEDLLYTSSISFQLAATLRRTKSDANDIGTKKDSLAVIGSSYDIFPKDISEELANALQHLVEVPNLSIKACNGHLNFYSAVKEVRSDKESHQVAISRESPMQESKGHGILPENPQRMKRKLEIHLNRSSFDPEEFALYRKYQIQVHNDEPGDINQQSYRRFLVDSPLIYVPPTGDDTVPSCGFGAFHQQYRIDGRLIAVGVIDILPKSLSSKYLFWDPDFAFLSLGKYSALQEINCVKENQRPCPSLQYYYLGYYIHSCSKMRYKAAYWPSELLCPLRYEWVPYDVAKPLLDRSRYAVLSDYTNMQNRDPMLTQEPGKRLDQQHDDPGDEDLNDAYMGEEENMLDSGSSEDEQSFETNDLASTPTENVDFSRILFDLGGTRLRYQLIKTCVIVLLAHYRAGGTRITYVLPLFRIDSDFRVAAVSVTALLD
uniref:Arginyl-tRNA--protein transferase n=1 Tax=Chenopodium quinoa TaxID=63459 RepID=A0A803M3R8_CHEQI